MNGTLAPVDLALIVAYLVLVLALGWHAGRRESSEGFLLADRKLGALESAASICASKTGGGLFLLYIAYIYEFGTAAFWIFIGFALGYGVFYFFADRLKQLGDAKRFFTLPDYFYYEYGPAPAYSSALTLLCFYLLAFATQLVGGAKILASLSGMSYALSVLLMGGVVVVYLAIGGFKAVVRTDVVQYLAIFILTVLVLMFLIPERNHLADLSRDLRFAMSPGVAAALFIGSLAGPFTAADLWQKIYATRTPALAKRSLLYAIILYTSFGLLLSVLGLLIKSQLPAADPDMALVIGFQRFLPAGLLGLGVVVLYAALMSSADTNLFTSASLVIQDLYEGRREQRDLDHTARGVRAAIVLIGILGLGLALVLPELIKLGFLYLALAVGTAATVLTTWVWRTVPARVLCAGGSASLATVIVGAMFIQDQRLVYASVGAYLVAGALALAWRPRAQPSAPA